MTQFVLDSFQALSSSIQTKIEEARQKFETEFVTSEFDSLIFTLTTKIDEINRLAPSHWKNIELLNREDAKDTKSEERSSRSSTGKAVIRERLTAEELFVISKKFEEVNEFVLYDIANYACKISLDEKLNDIIKNFSNDCSKDLKTCQILYETLGLIALARTTKDEIDRCVHYVRAYQLFRELATNYWDNIPLEARQPFSVLAYFLVKSLLTPHLKILEAGTSSLISIFEKDKDLKLLKKKQLENLSVSGGESSKSSNYLKEISNYLPELEEVVNIAMQQTRQWMELGIDISDPCVVTPLEETADNYPEIAEYCNDCLIELVKEQMNQIKNSSPDINEEMLDEF
jgi:ribosomal protein S16